MTILATGSEVGVAMDARASLEAAGTPTRVVTGLDSKRVAQLGAILESRSGLQLAGQDTYVKIAGGLRLTDPAVDLGLTLAMASSLRERASGRTSCPRGSSRLRPGPSLRPRGPSRGRR